MEHEIEIYTQAQRCRMYFGPNWMRRIRPEFHPQNIEPKALLGAPSRIKPLDAHIRHQLAKMARS